MNNKEATIMIVAFAMKEAYNHNFIKDIIAIAMEQPKPIFYYNLIWYPIEWSNTSSPSTFVSPHILSDSVGSIHTGAGKLI